MHPPHEVSPCTSEQGSGCGLYAVYTPDSPVLRGMIGEAHVLGVVVMSGVKEFHTLGMRAQFARPLALFEHLSVRHPRWTQSIRNITSNYGLPIINQDYALDFASEHGVLIDPSTL